MKSTVLVKVASFLSIYSVLVSLSHAAEAQSPSERAKMHGVKEETVSFVLVERSDFRLLYCTNDVLQSRIKRNMCIVDEIFNGPKELRVESGQTVLDLLKALGKTQGNTQIRLITKDAIEQTPLTDVPNRRRDVLSRQIHPGDIVVLAARI